MCLYSCIHSMESPCTHITRRCPSACMHARMHARSLAHTHARTTRHSEALTSKSSRRERRVALYMSLFGITTHARAFARHGRSSLPTHKQHKTLTANQRACARAIEHIQEKSRDGEKSESQGETENETDTEPTTKARARARDRLMLLRAPRHITH